MKEMINDGQTNSAEGEVKTLAWGKVKKWDHLPVRPATFKEFMHLKENKFTSCDAFVKELLKIYQMRLAYLEKKRLEVAPNV